MQEILHARLHHARLWLLPPLVLGQWQQQVLFNAFCLLPYLALFCQFSNRDSSQLKVLSNFNSERDIYLATWRRGQVTSPWKAPWDKFHIPIYLFQPNWPVWCMFWGTFFKSSKSWGIFQKNRFLGSIFGVFSCSAAISEPICMKFWLPG